MTERLFEIDPYIQEFEATVTECVEKKGIYHIGLDRSAFFPEGGGQPGDRGDWNTALCDWVIKNVQEDKIDFICMGALPWFWEPIKDKILAVLPGNHENRIYRSDGIDITEMMCAQLGLDCYAPTGAFIYVRFGRLSAHKHNRKVCYTIYATHGSGAGRTEGAKIKRLSDLAAICDADVYIHSHTHLPAVFKTVYFRPDPTKNSVYEVSRLFVNTGAALDYGGYGEALGFKPASTETPLIKLCGTQKRAAAVL